MDLSGSWSFQLDPQDVGLHDQWFTRPLSSTIDLPGSLQSQGFGDEPAPDSPWTGDIIDRSYFEDPRYEPYRQPGNIKVPFWLQPDRVYVGAAWYQKTVTVPEEWRGRHVTLFLERPHWETRLWLCPDGGEARWIGVENSLGTPHQYDLGLLEPGSYTLTLRVDNRRIVDVGSNASSITDHTQTNWNGLVGRIELNASAPYWIEDVQVYPDVQRRSAQVFIRTAGAGAENLGQYAHLRLQAASFNTPNPQTYPELVLETRLDSSASEMWIDYPLGPDAPLWDEYQPALIRLDVSVEIDSNDPESARVDTRSVTFGLRQVSAEGTQVAVNGRKIFIRGTLECCIFPLTGYPPTDLEAWRKVLRAARSYGLNSLRFHSWCPPEAAFQAGDEMGFYFQVECSTWANQGATIGEGKPLDEWLYEEGRKITRAFGNHPSFLLMAYGNEPAGKMHEYLSAWVNYWKARDPRRLYTSGAGWPMLPENQYHNVPEPRIQAWGEQLNSRINAKAPETLTDYRDFVVKAHQPVISHEIGQWCVYPNFEEISKYTGVLKAKNFEIFRDSLSDNGMGDQAHDFLIASGKLQVLCYKEEIESALRTPGFGGIFLLDLHDFPGQGTALVGVLDPFWEDKGYVTGPEYSRFCNDIVPLARMSKRCWTANETLTAEIDIANFSPAALENIQPVWQLSLVDADSTVSSVVASGSLPNQTIPQGNQTAAGENITLGSIAIPLQSLPVNRQYVLQVALPGVKTANGNPALNTWDVWVFEQPTVLPAPADILVCTALNDEAQQRLAQGGKVLLLLDPAQVETGSQIGFSSVFWNTAWTSGQAPHTLGLLMKPEAPLFQGFPTHDHSDWQWWDLVHGSAAMQLDEFDVRLRPFVQPIDTWFENRRLGLLFEAQVNHGKLMVCSMDLTHQLDQRPVASRFRRSLLQYLESESFAPTIEASVEQIQNLVK
jgi:hypothetical protein